MLKVLGPIVTADGGGKTAHRGRRGRVLAVLAARAGEPVSVDALEEAVWDGSPPTSSRNAIQVYISEIRRHDVAVATVPTGYLLPAAPEVVDAAEFEQLAAAAAECRDLKERVIQLQAALDIWRGRAFEPFESLDIVRPAATYLEQLRLDVEDLLTDARLESGVDLGLVEQIRKLVDLEPLRENRWGQLMLGLYRAQRQADALRTFREASRVLGEELGIEPGPKLRVLEERILLQDALLDSPAVSVPELPSWPTELVGRDGVISELTNLVARNRLVTLVGLGGVGKTRVAVEVARRVAPRYRDGLVYIDLTGLSRDGDVSSFFAERIGSGMVSGGSAARGVRDQKALVVLDNCEHVIAGVTQLLEAALLPAPEVHVLATSRIPLGVYGETILPLRELAAEGDALVLFEQSAQRARPGFSLADDDRAAAAEISAAVGGIPLLIELAASKLGDRSLHRLREQLAGSAEVTPGEELVDATIGWAIGQLSGPARSAAAALSVFRGGWTAANGAAVLEKLGTSASSDVYRELARASLIQFTAATDRYNMVEPVRRCAQRGDPETVAQAREVHTSLFVGLALEALPYVSGYGRNEWLDDLQAEHDNLRAMVDRAIAAKNPDVLPALGSLGFLWFRRFRQGEAAAWFDRVEEVFDLTVEQQPLTAIQSAHAAMWAGDPDTATARIERIEPLVMNSETPFLIGRLLHSRGNICGWGFGTPGASLQYFDRATDVLAPNGDPLAVVSTLSEAYMAVRSGNRDRAAELLPLVTRLSTKLAPAFGSMGEDQIRGLLALYDGDLTEAVRLLTRSLDKLDELGMIALRGPLLVPLAWSHLLAGNLDRARSLATEAHSSVIEDNGGWRVGEAAAALGGVSLAEGKVEAAQRWFTLAFESALTAPEADILVWAGMGLLAAADWRDEPRRLEFAAATRRFAVDATVVIPETAMDLLRLPEGGSFSAPVNAGDLNLIMKGAIDA